MPALNARSWILLFLLAAASAGCGSGGSDGARADGGSGADAGSDGGDRPDVVRVVHKVDAGADCGGVPTQGRCKDARTIEACFVPEALAAGAPIQVVTTQCDPGEHCASDKLGARCVPDHDCVSGQTECLDATTLQKCVDGVWQTSSCAACLQGADQGAACAGQAPGPGGIFVHGRLGYEYRQPTADLRGLQTTPTVEGAVGLRIQVWDGALIGEGETFGGGNGYNAGEFQLQLAQPPSPTASIHFFPIDRAPTGKPRLAVAVASQPDESEQFSNAYYSWRTDLCANAAACAGPNIELGEIVITEANQSGAIHIFQWLNYGLDQLRLIYPGQPQPTLVAFWSPKNEFNCEACFAGPQFGGAKVFPWGSHVDSYDTSLSLSGNPPFHELPSVITHELGHFVMAAYSIQTFEGGDHLIDGITSPGLAWSEGWATFYGQSLLSPTLFESDPIHFSASKAPGTPPWFWWADLEQRTSSTATGSKPLPAPNPAGPVDQNVNETLVASVVWSLWAQGRAQTPQSLGDLPIFQALNSKRLINYNRGYKTPDLVDFLDALACSDPQYVPGITNVVTAAGYPWHPQDVICAP